MDNHRVTRFEAATLAFVSIPLAMAAAGPSQANERLNKKPTKARSGKRIGVRVDRPTTGLRTTNENGVLKGRATKPLKARTQKAKTGARVNKVTGKRIIRKSGEQLPARVPAKKLEGRMRKHKTEKKKGNETKRNEAKRTPKTRN